MSAQVVVRAPAKINLSLCVLGRRPDGYHELDTVLMALELADELTLEASGGESDSLEVGGPAAAGVPGDETNLVLRAVRGLRAVAAGAGQRAPGLRLRLTKRIPVQAGLGGGSADAAAAVLGACRLFGLDPDRPEVLEVLAALGSDCPFFLTARAGGSGRCTGRGERVEPWTGCELPWTIALFTPGFGCATGEVYRAIVPAVRTRIAAFDPARARASLEGARASLCNELERAAERAHPALAALRARLEARWPGTFRLAGSGSSFFGFFPDARGAEAALAAIEADEEARRYGFRGRWVLPARSRGLALVSSTSH